MDGRRPTVSSLHGMVTCSHPLAARAGARLLAEGGNAFDAAAASAAALNVVEPYMSGLAGMGISTWFIASEQRVRTLDFVTQVPSQFPAGRFTRREQMLRTPCAAGTPGNLAGWCELVQRHGRRKLNEVFAPVIALAEDGFPLVEDNAANINQVAQTLQGVSWYDGWNAAYTGSTGVVQAGQVLHQPALARTFREIVAEGPHHLHGGALGRAMVEHMQALGGCLSIEDLTAVRPIWRDPIAADYRDLTVHTLPPPCEGFQYLLTLRVLDGFDLASLGLGSIEHLDVVWRAIRLAAGERIAHNNPTAEVLAQLFAPPNVERLRARVRDGRPVDGPTEQWIAPEPPHPDKGHTTSLSVADREGNVICITQSLGALFGCGVVVPDTGVCLNNFLYWGEADNRGPNALVPGGPLALPMAPSIATADGRPVLALGTPGSYGICQTQVQALVHYRDFGLALQDAIEAPRARLWDGRRVQAEGRIAPDVVAGLRARGHDVEVAEPWMMPAGSMQGIVLDPGSGRMTGGADPRRAGYAATP
jgi:gamma-glutamyltranspeptidase/glutathione hydrolase